MRQVPEQVESFGLGKKVETPKETETVTRRVDGKQHHYETDGKRSYCPPVPDGPMHPSPWDMWRQYMQAQGITVSPEDGVAIKTICLRVFDLHGVLRK